jgi:hypothetical protein
VEAEKLPRRRRVRYKRRGNSSRLEVIVAAVFAVIGIVLTITFVRLGGASSSVDDLRIGTSETATYRPISTDRIAAVH